MNQRPRTSVKHQVAALVAVVLAWGWCVHFWPAFQAANESARLALTMAWVDHGTPCLDPVLARYGVDNLDAARFEGRRYADKAPGLSLLAAPAYWMLTRVAGMSTAPEALPSLAWLLTLWCVGLPAACGLLWTAALVRDITDDERAGWAAALLLGLASPYALYATLLFGHATAAALGVGSLLHARRGAPWRAGLLGGAMVLVDTATAPLAAGIAVVGALGREQGRCGYLVRHAAAGVPGVAAQLLYNAALFGSPWTFAYAFKQHDAFAALHGQGVYGFGLPRAEALLGLSIGPQRGLLYHAPWVALALLTWRSRRARPLLLLALGYAGWIAGFADWRAGDAFGPRHLTPCLPLLAAALGCALARQEGAAARRALPPLAVAGAALAWLPILTWPYAQAVFAVPAAQLQLPLLAAGHVAPTALGAPPSSAAYRLAVSLGPPLAFASFALWRLALLPRRGDLCIALLGGAALLACLLAPFSPPDVARADEAQALRRAEQARTLARMGYGDAAMALLRRR